jgi:site-specific recombinase XerD
MVNLDLKTAHKSFIQYLTDKRRAHATILAYGKDIDQLVGFLTDMGEKNADEVKKEDLEAFLSKLTKDGYTLKSVSRKINSIKTFYRFLRASGYLTVDQASEIVHPKIESKPPRILTKMEYRALRDACRADPRLSAIIEIFLQTGLRIAELANLKLKDVKEDSLYVTGEEGHQPRTVPLNKAAKSAIDRYLQVRPTTKDDALFVTKTGRPLLIRNIRTSIDRFFRVAGIQDAKVNDLRHTFIAHHLAAGTPLTVISRLVGHKRLSTTEKYLGLVKEKPEENVRLEEL